MWVSSSAGTTLCSEQLYEPVMSCGALDHPLDPVKFQPCMAWITLQAGKISISGTPLLVISKSEGVCMCTEGCGQVTREVPVCWGEPEVCEGRWVCASEHVCLTENMSEPVCSSVAAQWVWLGPFSSCVNTLLSKLRALVNDFHEHRAHIRLRSVSGTQLSECH